MWNKVYLIALLVFLVLMSILTYVSWDWLGSLTNPKDVAENYRYYSNFSWYFLWISAATLLALAIVILWKTRQSWAFWITLFYFVLFIILQTFWLDPSFEKYQEKWKLISSAINLSPLIGAGLIISAAVVIYFNQFLVLRMNDKMFAKSEPAEVSSEDKKSLDETTIEDDS